MNKTQEKKLLKYQDEIDTAKKTITDNGFTIYGDLSKVLELNGLSKEISNIYDKSTSFPSAKNESWSKAENSIELIEDIQNLLSPYINIEYLDLYENLRNLIQHS